MSDAERNTGGLQLVDYPENARYFVVRNGVVLGSVSLGSIEKLSPYEIGQAHRIGLEVPETARRYESPDSGRDV